jgi:Domain of unknown function (DUF4386)
MHNTQQTARRAGLLYFIVVITGIFSLAYVPSKLIDFKDATLTLQQIRSGELLFRLGIIGSVICYTAFTLLPLVLYKLLNPVSKNMAWLMVILALLSVPISFLNLQHKYSVLALIEKTDALATMNGALSEQVLFQLKKYNNGILIAQVFWGLWLFPFGYLVYKSGFLPKGLGLLLMLGCIGYLANFTGNTLSGQFDETGLAGYSTLPASLGEIGICLWLLIIGVRKKTGKVNKNDNIS